LERVQDQLRGFQIAVDESLLAELAGEHVALDIADDDEDAAAVVAVSGCIDEALDEKIAQDQRVERGHGKAVRQRERWTRVSAESCQLPGSATVKRANSRASAGEPRRVTATQKSCGDIGSKSGMMARLPDCVQGWDDPAGFPHHVRRGDQDEGSG